MATVRMVPLGPRKRSKAENGRLLEWSAKDWAVLGGSAELPTPRSLVLHGVGQHWAVWAVVFMARKKTRSNEPHTLPFTKGFAPEAPKLPKTPQNATGHGGVRKKLPPKKVTAAREVPESVSSQK